jgi:AcrR family transcriptional regulator
VTARNQHGAARREALLDAALACFEERGLVHTGIEDVRKAAGASPSSVYHLFGGLPDLIAALLERTFVRRYREVSARVLETRTARAAVLALVEAHLAWVLGHPAEARFMYRALALDLDHGHRDELRALKDQLKADLSAHLVRLGVSEGAAAPDAIDVILLGVTHQACRAWLSAPGRLDPQWMKAMLPALAWETVRAMRGPRRRAARPARGRRPRG